MSGPVSLFVLRITKRPDAKYGKGIHFRPGLYCSGILNAFLGRRIGRAVLYETRDQVDEVRSLVALRHPGMEVEVVELREAAKEST